MYMWFNFFYLETCASGILYLLTWMGWIFIILWIIFGWRLLFFSNEFCLIWLIWCDGMSCLCNTCSFNYYLGCNFFYCCYLQEKWFDTIDSFFSTFFYDESRIFVIVPVLFHAHNLWMCVRMFLLLFLVIIEIISLCSWFWVFFFTIIFFYSFIIYSFIQFLKMYIYYVKNWKNLIL